MIRQHKKYTIMLRGKKFAFAVLSLFSGYAAYLLLRPADIPPAFGNGDSVCDGKLVPGVVFTGEDAGRILAGLELYFSNKIAVLLITSLGGDDAGQTVEKIVADYKSEIEKSGIKITRPLSYITIDYYVANTHENAEEAGQWLKAEPWSKASPPLTNVDKTYIVAITGGQHMPRAAYLLKQATGAEICSYAIHEEEYLTTTIKERIKLAFARVGFPAIPGYQVGSIANRFFWLLRGLKADH
jgi:uncharacterized SAM-binding protein YcdF (DUF218 family)